MFKTGKFPSNILILLQANHLYKSYKPKGEFSISGCGTSIIEKSTDNQVVNSDFAVNDISLRLEKSQIVSILGSNGSGKSTLLKILAGLMEPDFGEVIFKKEQVYGPVKKLVAGHDKIKLIHQNYNLFPNISLGENVAYNLRFHTKDYQERRLQELFELCDLEEIKDKLPRNASGGEQQRAAIATALAADAEILLFDEPFANLDVFNKSELKSHIKRIATKSKVAILFVTHDAHDALSISNEVLIMKEGQFIQSGTSQQLYERPENVYVAELTGLTNILNFNTLESIIPNSGLQRKRSKVYSIRPEHIELMVDNNSIYEVVDSLYFGDYWLSIIQLEKRKLLKIKTPHLYEVGQRVSITLKENRIVEVTGFRH